MIDVIPFKKEHISDDDLKKEMLARFFQPSEQYLRNLEISGCAFSGIQVGGETDGKIVGCAGIFELWEGVGEAWSFLTDEARNKPFMLHRAVKRGFARIMREHNFHRVQMLVQPGYKVGERWAESLGFFKEGPRFRYGSDKQSYNCFVHLRET